LQDAHVRKQPSVDGPYLGAISVDDARGPLRDLVVRGASLGMTGSTSLGNAIPAPKSSGDMGSGAARLLLPGSPDSPSVTPGFKAKTRCSSYVCPGSSCHTYGQNVNTENQYLYYIIIYYKNLLQVQKGISSRKDTILPQADDQGFHTPRRSLHQSTPHLLSSRS
jgi:hypothetical protein